MGLMVKYGFDRIEHNALYHSGGMEGELKSCCVYSALSQNI